MQQTLCAIFWTIGLWVVLAVAWPRRQPRIPKVPLKQHDPARIGRAKANGRYFDAEMDLV